jgi:hypothetical protein
VAADDPGGLFIDQGSPILIGGGSVNINFREGSSHFQPVPGSPGRFVKTNDEIDTILIVDASGVLTNNLLSVVNGKDCRVIIHTKRPGDTLSDDIIVTSQTGGNLDLSFTAGEFGPHPTDPNRPHFNANRKLVDSLDVEVAGQTVSFAVPTNGIGTILIINSKP